MIEKLRFYTWHSLNDLRVNGQRTVFALLCIAVGVAAIVSLQTLGVMIEDTLTGSIQESNRGDIRIFPNPDVDEESGEQPNRDQEEKLIARGIAEGVLGEGGAFAADYVTLSGLDTLQTWFSANYPGTVITYRQTLGREISAVSINVPSKDTEKPLVQPFIVEVQAYPLYGERLAETELPLRALIQGPTDIVLSRNLADDLGVDTGDVVRLSGAREDFIVGGILPTAAESGFENIFGALFGYYFIDVSAVELFDELTPGADVVFVRLPDPSRVAAVNTALLDRFPYLSTTTTAELDEQNSEISHTINQMVIVMGLVSLLIGGIGIVNTMLVIVSRRTTEIAVLKTVGLEGEQITVLFLVEAILMGIGGSLLGIALGWIAALAIKGVAEGFLTQSLTFRLTWQPPLTGFVVGVIVTTIFGFIPTLAAGNVRPNLVLHPSDTVVPKAGRSRSFVALLFVMLALSLVAQSLIRDLLDSDQLRSMAQLIGAGLGTLMGLAMIQGGIYVGWTRNRIGLRLARWLLLMPGLPVLGFLFGYEVPALLILFGTFMIAGVLYVVLWMLIWIVGGGSLTDVWLLRYSQVRAFRLGLARSPGWIGKRAFGLLVGLLLLGLILLVWAVNFVLLALMLPFWLLGRVIQRVAFVDFRLALRSMLVTKGRGASTLLALVVGVFTLSLITMLATAVTKRFEEILVDEVGGNVIVFAAGASDTLETVQARLDEADGVKSYSALGTFDAKLSTAKDISEHETLTFTDLEERVIQELDDEYWVESLRWRLGGIDARETSANLPNVDFYAGRQLNDTDSGPWDPDQGLYPPIVISADEAVIATGLMVGDLLTFEVSSASDAGSRETRLVTFEIVGMVDRTGANIEVSFGAPNYVPKSAFDDLNLAPDIVSAIVDVDREHIHELRQSMNEIPGVFVLETRLLNDLINRMIEQFTSFPILVAGLALVVGGIVIANSVALATLERQREIAIMKAIGVQRERVLGMLLLEYGLKGLIGGLIGVGLGGIGLLYLMIQAFGGELGKSIPYVMALELMGLCVLIALVAAVVTAWRASGEKPLNVLRYE